VIIKKELADGVVVYNADCRDVLPTLGKVDAVVTDPPYGIGAASSFGWRSREEKALFKGDKAWDNEVPSKEIFDLIIKISQYQIIWGGNYFELPPSKSFFIWDKVRTLGESQGMAEFCHINFGGASKIYRYHSRGEAGLHPTQKPLQLMEWCLEMLPDPSQLILDPYMGSGTTGVAAVSMGRKFIGIEREPEYFDIACKRISDVIKQPGLF
jgi:site-specific DNA-methyltransferase (adenine-specific)